MLSNSFAHSLPGEGLDPAPTVTSERWRRVYTVAGCTRLPISSCDHPVFGERAIIGCVGPPARRENRRDCARCAG